MNCEICGKKLVSARRKYCPGLCEKAGARRAEEKRNAEFRLFLRHDWKEQLAKQVRSVDPGWKG